MYAQLGSTIFQGLFGYSEHEATYRAKYAEVDLLQGKPDLHRMGTALDEIELSIRLHEAFCEPELRVSELKSYLNNGDVLPYVSGNGNLIGNFVLLKMTVSTEQTDVKGRLINCECKLSIKEYVSPDRALIKSNNARASAFALGALPGTVVIASPPPNVPSDIMSNMKQVSASVMQASEALAKAQSQADAQATFLQRVVLAANETKQEADLIRAKVEAGISEVNNAEEVINTARAMGDHAVLMAEAALNGDLPNTLNAFTLMGASASALNVAARPSALQVVLR